MTFEQSLSSRLVAIRSTLLLPYPMGFIAISPCVRPGASARQWMKNMADVLAYVTFQSPVYVAILWSVGADWHQIVAAVSSNGGIDDDGRRLRLLPRLLPPPVPRGALSAGEGLTNALAATGSASRLSRQPASLGSQMPIAVLIRRHCRLGFAK